MCGQLKKYKRLIIVSIIVFVIIIGVIYLLNLPPKNKEEKINVNDVTVVKDSKDPNVRDLYHQLNPEEGTGTKNLLCSMPCFRIELV